MIDAHTHCRRGTARHFFASPTTEPAHAGDFLFVGTHPWDCATYAEAELRAALEANPRLGVGEIGLDRLNERTISAAMREVFESQLRLAAEFHRPVVLHGARCWGQVVAACQQYRGRIPAFLFHGFSRSWGLLPEIASLNGFISVGPAILNDHAVNYREAVRTIPRERLLLETDALPTDEAPTIEAVLASTAQVLGMSPCELEALTDANARRFLGEET